MLLLMKLTLTPLFVGMIALVSRRWGTMVSGWLIGLPLTSAPVSLFLALEQGTAFVSRMAQGTLMGVVSQALFCVAYAWLSFRVNWLGNWLIGWSVFFAATFIFAQVMVPFSLIPVVVMSSLVVVLLLWPRQREQAVRTSGSAWEIVGRMVVATSFVLILTSAANALGPHLSGLLSPLPVFATVFAIFNHRFQGAEAARQVLRGVIVSSFACMAFFLVVAGLIESWGILATFSGAILAALFTQGCVLWLLRRFSHLNQQRVEQGDNLGRRA